VSASADDSAGGLDIGVVRDNRPACAGACCIVWVAVCVLQKRALDCFVKQ
jgi:hypothetical protein